MTEGWDGRGLPPAAAARVQRVTASGVRGSLFSVGELAATELSGFDPVGEAMGCIVEHIGFAGYAGCGAWSYGGFGRGTVTSGQRRGWSGYAPYVDALYRGWDTALARMALECSALGGDGVVGVRLEQRDLGAGNQEFLALGSAVRARASRRPSRPFLTNLSGQDVAKLLSAGWVPAAVVFGIAVAIRHDDYGTRMQSSAWTANVEVAGYTELVTHVRADARHQFGVRAARAGADAAVVSAMRLHVWEMEPAENHRDHVAESTVVGTGLAHFRPGQPTPRQTLTMLPLRPAPARQYRQ